MLNRRHFLLVAAASVLASTVSHAKPSTDPALLASLLGTWKISAVLDASAPSDSATITQVSPSSVLLNTEGEIAKLLGGAVALSAQGADRLGGTSKTGVEVTLTPHSSNRWNLTIQGNGLYFSLYLVK